MGGWGNDSTGWGNGAGAYFRVLGCFGAKTGMGTAVPIPVFDAYSDFYRWQSIARSTVLLANKL